MHAKPLALASAVAMAASVVAVQPEHPRIYFPRVIKRDYQNSSITTSSGASSKPDTTADSTTKRDLLGDLISEILNSSPPSASSTDAKKPAVTTVVIRSTVYVGGGQPSGSGLPSVTILPTTKAAETTQPTTKTDSSTESGIVIGPTGIVSSTTVEPTKVASVDPPVGNSTTTTKGGILDPVGTLLSSLLPGPASQSTSTGDATIPVNSTAPATTIASTTTGILPPLTSLLPGGDTTTTSGTGSLPNATSTDISATATIPSSSTVTSIPTGTVTDVPVGNTTSTTSGTVPPVTTATDGPATNGTVSVTPTGSLTALPTGSVPVGNSTQTEVSSTAASTVIPTTVAETTTSVPPTTDPAVTSIRPTATFSNSENWLPTTMVVEPTTISYSPPTASTAGTTSQALPTTIPKNILPNDPPKSAPEGTVPIQIAFKYQLNYLFVSNNTVAAAQIFQLLPRALADASGISVDKLQISKLVPYNTQAKWGYIATIAKLNYPSTLVDTLQMDMRIANSLFYNNPDQTVRDLTKFVDIRFDLNGNIVDGGASGGATGSGAGGDNSNNKNNNDAFGTGNQGEQSSKQKATTAGIAVACVGLSAMYGAAMFIVARRYKRKRQGHRRASSITNSQASSEMRYHGNGSPALMGGALMSREVSTYGGAGGRDSHASGGQSARTAGISAPVATENSLGWN